MWQVASTTKFDTVSNHAARLDAACLADCRANGYTHVNADTDSNYHLSQPAAHVHADPNGITTAHAVIVGWT